MSVLQTLIKDEHTFAAWAEKELAKLFTEAPKIEQIADAVLTYAGGALQIVLGAEAGPAAAATVGAIVSTAKTGLVALNGLITDFGATPTAVSIASSIQTNLSSLLAAGQVKSATSISAITKVVSSLGALTTALSTAPAAAPVAKA